MTKTSGFISCLIILQRRDVMNIINVFHSHSLTQNLPGSSNCGPMAPPVGHKPSLHPVQGVPAGSDSVWMNSSDSTGFW